ncbi:MAG: cytochrome-c oxidase, cbb3-type subunit II, partial [Planctomycetota bacterium]
LMWRAMTPEGQLAYPNFVETTIRIIPFYYVRFLGGALFLGGAVLCAYNVLRTWGARPQAYQVEEHEAPPLTGTHPMEPKPATELVAVTDGAKRLQVFSTLWWHRSWERKPLKFTVWTTIAVLTASLFEIIPTFVIRSNVPTIAGVEPYTPLELCGRDIYVNEGCYNCHSQQIRPMLAETKRYGDWSQPGEFIYDHPFQWGSRRIGPDLAREGGRQSTYWHVEHFKAPAEITPGSIMPGYEHFAETKLDWTEIPLRMRAMQALGVPYTDEQVKSSIEDAKAQARVFADEYLAQSGDTPYVDTKGREVALEEMEVIALVAYLQRLGTDLYRTPDGAIAEAGESEGTGETADAGQGVR